MRYARLHRKEYPAPMREAVAEVGSIGLSLWLVDAEKILPAVVVIWSQKADA